MIRFFHRAVPLLVALGIVGLAVPVGAGESVPFRGGADETVIGVAPAGSGLLQLTVTFTGEATLLGRYTGTEQVIFDPAAGTISGTRVFVAANGDRLYADVQGAFTSPTNVEGTITITGGTGRFSHASGEADFELFSADQIHLALRFDGAIEF